jgi:hypothetical protein
MDRRDLCFPSSFNNFHVFCIKKLDFRDTFGEWIFVEFTKEEASEVVGVVDDNGLFAANPIEKPSANFLMRVVWIAGK